MTTFDNREKAEEAAFAAHESSEFAARARRDKLLGQWAAGLLGLHGEHATAYAKSLVNADLESHGDADVIAKLKADFAAKNIDVSVNQIESMMKQKMAEAHQQLKA